MRTKFKDIVKRLVSTFPDSIVENDGVVDYDETVGKLADRIMEEIPENYMINIFGTTFTGTEYCEDFLRERFPNLYDECQKIIDERYGNREN